MKNILLIIIIFLSSSNLYSKELMGRDYWIAIPPNETSNYLKFDLKLLCSSQLEGTIKLYSNMGLNISKNNKANEVLTFSENKGDLSWDYEFRKSDTVLNKAIRVYADIPFVLNVVNQRNTTSEGYTAIPVNALGNKYIHCSYYDNAEGGSSNNFKSGFVIIAHENNTFVNIKIRGTGKGFAKTDDGMDIGSSYRTNLNRGQIFAVQGDGTTRMLFDITGSEVSSIDTNQRFGMISYHMRTPLPKVLSGSRSHLVEMLPPVSSWGSEYLTVQYDRGKNKGDMFRIVGAKEKTHFKATWYDPDENNKLVSNWEGILHKPGDFVTFKETIGDKSIYGCSVFRSWDDKQEEEKPIMVMQYSYSAGYDGANNFDPFMVLVPPTEKYFSNAIVQVTNNPKEAILSILARHDPEDEEFEDLKSIKINEKKLHEIDSDFLQAKIPGTDYHWATISIDSSFNFIKANTSTKLGAFVYANDGMSFYGYPVQIFDGKENSHPIIINYYRTDSSYIFICKRKILNDINYDGIKDIDFLDNTVNLDISPIASINFPVDSVQFECMMQDKYLPVSFTITALAETAIVASESSSLNMNDLEISPESIDFQQIRSGLDYTATFTINNPVDSNRCRIYEIITDKDFYEFENYSPNINLEAGESKEIILKINPDIGLKNEDKITIRTSYKDYQLRVKYNTYSCQLELEDDYDYGLVDIRNEKEEALEMKNFESFDIQIQKVYLTNGTYFTITEGMAPPEYYLASLSKNSIKVKFSPDEKDKLYRDTLVVEFDKGVNYIILSGTGDYNTSIESADQLDLVSLSPNPVSNNSITLHINSTSSEITYSINDINGKEVLKGNIFNNTNKISKEIDISNLSSGSYYVRIDLGNEIISKHFVVIK